ncbi:2-amino-3,7-dideoxy-D-threo-hept-6-ulosonate synthase [Halocella sp. SP3-1]|uniref:class I fructose-bisphosphate aldolase n=1 Tax=Halocella sp. SP3-1 TaxID=2382161 RepID=UPI000F7535FD|nr:2-amino-3,7-dideoxy-D-threo-hept-6-ulosonate synthase [Halocella sp. SP3-1]AZO93653.1 fructose-bisphosphate aldolase [Halocella sp. SP3-1]
MNLGKKIRLSRILNRKSKKLLAVAIDHPIAHGVLPGIDNIDKVLEELVKGKPDAITMHKGIAKMCFDRYAGSDISFLLKCTSFSPYHKNYDTVVAEIEEAISLGADGISVGTILGGQYQSEMLSNLSRMSQKAEYYGLPLFSHIYPRGECVKDKFSSKVVSYAARTAAELGVDIAKTHYTGSKESFKKVVDSTPINVVIAGGVGNEDVEQLLKMTKDAMDAGAIGVTYGRSIWQYESPAKMIKALKYIIHQNASVKEALDILRK